MENLKKIINEVKSCKGDDFSPSDDMILDCSTRILLSKTEEKKPKVKNIQGNKFKIKDPTAPATDKQKGRLDELKVKYPETLTKGEAHELIKEHGN